MKAWLRPRCIGEIDMLKPTTNILPEPAVILDWILGRRDGEITHLFEELGSASPRLDWDPEPETFESGKLRQLNEHWRGLAGDGVPARSDFYPEDVAYMLGNLALIELCEETGDLRYRLFGTTLAERYERDLTGTAVAETAETLARFFAAAFRGVLREQRPLYTRHLPPNESEVNDCQRLILPFADGNGVARHLLIGHLPYRAPLGSVARSIG